MQCMVEKNHVSGRIENSLTIKNMLKCMNAPRMIPDDIELKCQQMHLDYTPTPPEDSNKENNTKKKKGKVAAGKKVSDFNYSITRLNSLCKFVEHTGFIRQIVLLSIMKLTRNKCNFYYKVTTKEIKKLPMFFLHK